MPGITSFKRSKGEDMTLQLHNTLTKKKQAFKPLSENHVRMYNCGPTVYNFAHIGNFRAYVCSDILKRYLLYKGYKVTQVMNLTDVDDKTIRDSQKEGTPFYEFTERYTLAFLEDMKTLQIMRPEIMPKATEHINEMVEIIKTLLKKGIAYKTNDGVYFSIEKFEEYGKLSGMKLDEAQRGTRCSHDEYDKTNVNDFALWKFWDESDGDVFWETELGKGRPGWHIECSAMSMKYLGENFDIHTGGIDLIFPHHENEIAQSEAATGKQFVQFWLHNEYILVNGKKMSKSLGNFYTLRDLIKKGYPAPAIRYLLLSSHYRQQLNFTLEGIDAAAQTVRRLQEFYDTLKDANGGNQSEIHTLLTKTKEQFEAAMDDDLNISLALSTVFDMIRDVNRLRNEKEISKGNAQSIVEFLKQIDTVLGVLEYDKEKIPKEIIDLAELREQKRISKDWAGSDALRVQIKSKGYEISDTKNGYKLAKILR